MIVSSALYAACFSRGFPNSIVYLSQGRREGTAQNHIRRVAVEIIDLDQLIVPPRAGVVHTIWQGIRVLDKNPGSIPNITSNLEAALCPYPTTIKH